MLLKKNSALLFTLLSVMETAVILRHVLQPINPSQGVLDLCTWSCFSCNNSPDGRQ